MNIIRPIIEKRFYEADPKTNVRKRAANIICEFLSKDSAAYRESLRDDFYNALVQLLDNPESERILLYLPLGFLEDAPKRFEEAYMNAWYRLLRVEDVRVNFSNGDCLEVDARPNGELERVVKCVHLLPWMVEAGFISTDEVIEILEKSSCSPTLLRSFEEAINVVMVRNSLGKSGVKLINLISDLTADIPKRQKVEPLYVSEKRLKWLEERKSEPAKLLTPSAKLEGPFSDNLEIIRPQLEEIEAALKPNEIVLVGGSQIKGYGTTKSDLDIWEYGKLTIDEFFRLGSPHAAHIYFNSVWIGSKTITNLDEIAEQAINIYSYGISKEDRRLCIERLENDLLQYRLLHKGFSRFVGKSSYWTGCYPEIDGDCPFYDDGYRRIATMLYAKYVYI